MIEKPAQGVKGCLLYTPFPNENGYKFFFRVYEEPGPEGHREFTDYQLGAEDVSITIDDPHISLYEDPDNPDKNKINWSSKTLGRPKCS